MPNNNYTFFENGLLDVNSFLKTTAKGIPGNDFPNFFNWKFEVMYPGALFGIGLPTIKSGDEYSIGINFDFVSGEPVYPSTSVKGILRSIFTLDKSKEYIKSIFKKYELTNNEVSLLEEALFEADNVIYFDAVFTRNGNNINKDVITDYITPHIDPSNNEKDYLKHKFKDMIINPNIIKMIRIPENTIVDFSFSIKDININDKIILNKDIFNAFKEILKFIGFGAKTNQGYGRLTKHSKGY